jgi:hypothetical protein
MDETHPTGGLEVYDEYCMCPLEVFRQVYCLFADGRVRLYWDDNQSRQICNSVETRVLRQLSGSKTFSGIKRPNEPLLHRIATLFEGCYTSKETEDKDNDEWNEDESDEDESDEDESDEDESEDDESEEDSGEDESREQDESGEEERAGKTSGGIDEVATKSFRAATTAAKPAKARAEWAVGDEVVGQFSDGNIYEATIREVHDNGDRYVVDWADGDERNRELTRREVFSLSAIDEVATKRFRAATTAPKPAKARAACAVGEAQGSEREGSEAVKKRKQCDTEPTVPVDEEGPAPKKTRESTMYLAVDVRSVSCVVQTDRLLSDGESNINGRIECDHELFSRLQEVLGRYKHKEIPCAKETKTLCDLVPAFEKVYPSYSLIGVLKEAAKKATLAFEQRENARKEWRKNIEEAKKKSEVKLYETIAPFLHCCGRQNAGFTVAPSEIEHARAQMERGQKYGAKELLRALQSVTK